MKLKLNLKLLVLTSYYLILLEFRDCCRDSDVLKRRAITYNLIKSDAKSTKPVITRRRVATVAKCKDIAETKSALAFNFERLQTADTWEANCILLHCPEVSGDGKGLVAQLVNATGVDYYSAYSNRNATLSCIEDVGLFVLVDADQQNFTNARSACRKLARGALLADPTSDARTRGLANLIGQLTVYVGLSNEPKDRIWMNEFGEAMSCFEYRAWGQGEPSHSRGCVALFRLDRRSDPIWKVVSCDTELPYICEIPHSQPDQVVMVVTKTITVKRSLLSMTTTKQP